LNRTARTFFLIALGLNVAIAVTARYFPFEDTTNHLARYVLLERAWFAGGVGLPPTVVVRPRPGPYFALDVVGAVLVHLVGPAWGIRLVAAMAVAAVPVGFALLLGAIGGEARRWAIVGVPFGFDFWVHAGFLSYVIGVGVAFAFLAAWWPHRRDPSPARVVGLVAGITLCYLMHLASALIVLTVIWIDVLHARDRRAWLVLLLTATVGAMYLWTTVGAPPLPPQKSGPLAWGTLWWKVKNIVSPFYTYSVAQALPMLATYVAAVALYGRANPVRTWRSTLGLAAVAFFVLYVIFPLIGTGGGYVDMRWLIPAYLLILCAAGAATRGPSTRGLALLLAGSVVSTVVLEPTILRIDRYLRDYDAVLEQLPPGKTVFPVIADDKRFGGRVIPYRHFAFWYAIRQNGRVPSLFDYSGDGMESNWFMPYIDDTAHLYAPPIGWFGGGGRLPPLDWQRIAAEDDYIIVAGRDSTMRAEVGAHATPLSSVGEVTVYTRPIIFHP
jgi:hypothetical protein